MQIEFKASDKNDNIVRAATAQEAVAQFLKTYRSRTIYVQELRDGIFKMAIGCDDPEHNYFYKRFESRAAAKAFAEAA